MKHALKKYTISITSSNDVAFFRYADVLLMKAEAMLRGATPTLGATPAALVNNVRTKRGAAAVASVDLEALFAERCREFAWEAWHLIQS